MEKKLELLYGSLLHDIGKIVYRSNDPKYKKANHSVMGWDYLKRFDTFKNKDGIKESVLYHHWSQLSNASIDPNSNAYITYVADNIASGIDRRDRDDASDFHFDKEIPLSSIFNIVNGEDDQAVYPFEIEKGITYPVREKKKYPAGVYEKLLVKMNEALGGSLKYSTSSFSSLLQWTESLWSNVPSSTYTKQLVDISLYDHSKITAGIASSIFDYLEEKNISNYKEYLFNNKGAQSFYEENAFMLLSLDLSGIQSFIYDISGSQALKRLRARSFYLEVLLEVVVDNLLEEISQTRANLLYTGGGHAYILLPNTNLVKDKIVKFEQRLKEWFLDVYNTDLSIAIAYEVCSGNDLMNYNGNYKQVWRNVSQKLSDKKAHKYNIDDIIKLNNKQVSETRECKECLRTDVHINDDEICSICDSIVELSIRLRTLNDGQFFVIQHGEDDNHGVPMPFNKTLKIVNKQKIQKNRNEYKYIYSQNEPYIGEDIYANLWICNYDKSSLDNENFTEGIASYTNRDIGVKRLGVLRADIDNLGKVFINGIPEQYNSISRTATLSRNLSMFFKYELKNIIDGSNITVIYSGGDDVFFIGSWDDVVKKSMEIREAFEKFTLNKLTFSAGIGLYHKKYPVSKMASETGELEENSKQGEKNQITLWRRENVYNWGVFIHKVYEEKLRFISDTFNNSEDKKRTFVYKIYTFITSIDEKNRINLARLSYILARSGLNQDIIQKIYQWSCKKDDREQLITALEYYIYEIRED